MLIAEFILNTFLKLFLLIECFAIHITKYVGIKADLDLHFLKKSISSVRSQKLVSLIFTFFKRDKKLNNFAGSVLNC